MSGRCLNDRISASDPGFCFAHLYQVVLTSNLVVNYLNCSRCRSRLHRKKKFNIFLSPYVRTSSVVSLSLLLLAPQSYTVAKVSLSLGRNSLGFYTDEHFISRPSKLSSLVRNL